MKIKQYQILFLLVVLTIVSCKKDDDGKQITKVEVRDRKEQQVVDRDSLLGYFETHYYNSSKFETPGNYTISDIVISELPKDGDGKYLPMPNPDKNTMLNAPGVLKTYTYTLDDTEYEYYVLNISEGEGESPHFTDAVRLSYSGNTMDEKVFDSSVNPTDIEMVTNTGGGVIKGWHLVIPKFKTASSFEINNDGTVAYSNYGLGVMFLPSGLGYYSNTQPSIPSYSNLIFKIALYQYEEKDHDGDGVASYLEDLDGDMSVLNDDTDGNKLPNYLDADDDGDGVLTKHEDLDGDGDPTNDIGKNGIPNYLDPQETKSNQQS